MNAEKLHTILEQLANSGEIKPSDIPDIDLYMDQVTTFIDNKLSREKRDKKDKLLTKTMINNYSKARILTPSRNKRYNKDQMIQLILIYYLKQVISINDVHSLFSSLFKLSQNDESLIEDIYTAYLQIKKDSMTNVKDMLEEKAEVISQSTFSDDEKEKDTVELILTVLALAAQAYAYKRTAEALIDNHFKPNT